MSRPHIQIRAIGAPKLRCYSVHAFLTELIHLPPSRSKAAAGTFHIPDWPTEVLCESAHIGRNQDAHRYRSRGCSADSGDCLLPKCPTLPRVPQIQPRTNGPWRLYLPKLCQTPSSV